MIIIVLVVNIFHYSIDEHLLGSPKTPNYHLAHQNIANHTFDELFFAFKSNKPQINVAFTLFFRSFTESFPLSNFLSKVWQPPDFNFFALFDFIK
jgi:hypothetical protein